MDSRIRPQTKHSYKKAGVAVAIVIVAIVAISLIMAVLLRKNSHIYMSDGSRIYDVSSLESQYICDVKDALFGLDEVTFYTPEWLENISKDSVVSSAASPTASIMRQMCIMMKMNYIHYMYGHRMEVWKL